MCMTLIMGNIALGSSKWQYSFWIPLLCFFCAFVCLSSYRLHCLTQETDILTLIPTCELQNGTFNFLHLNIFVVFFFFRSYSPFSVKKKQTIFLFQGYQSTYHENRYTKLKLETSTIEGVSSRKHLTAILENRDFCTRQASMIDR